MGCTNSTLNHVEPPPPVLVKKTTPQKIEREASAVIYKSPSTNSDRKQPFFPAQNTPPPSPTNHHQKNRQEIVYRRSSFSPKKELSEPSQILQRNLILKRQSSNKMQKHWSSSDSVKELVRKDSFSGGGIDYNNPPSIHGIPPLSYEIKRSVSESDLVSLNQFDDGKLVEFYNSLDRSGSTELKPVSSDVENSEKFMEVQSKKDSISSDEKIGNS